GGGGQLLDGSLIGAQVDREGGGQDADQDQHDQAHAFLAVVRAVTEAYASAGEDQQPANPQRRGFVLLGRLIQIFAMDEQFRQQQQKARAGKADQRGNQQGGSHFARLGPVDAFTKHVARG